MDAPKERARRVACRVCGAPFATPAQVKAMQERMGLPEGLAHTCPACRAALARERIAGALFAQRVVSGRQKSMSHGRPGQER